MLATERLDELACYTCAGPVELVRPIPGPGRNGLSAPCLLSFGLAIGRPLPVYPDKQTCSGSVGMSQVPTGDIARLTELKSSMRRG